MVIKSFSSEADSDFVHIKFTVVLEHLSALGNSYLFAKYQILLARTAIIRVGTSDIWFLS